MSCTGLIETRAADPETKEFTAIMRKASDNMVDMVQELLDFARGKSSLELHRYPAEAVIAEIDAQLRHMVPNHVHVIREIRFCDDVMIDLGRFTRVLLNLVKNSVEAMPTGGVLRIGLRQEGEQAIFRVGDTGCGISPELQAKIFEPFVTYGKSKGTGLGMAIAKGVVEAHGGQISVRSALKRGTTVEVTLPAVSADCLAPPGIEPGFKV